MEGVLESQTSDAVNAFQWMGASHLSVIALTVAASLLMVFAARRYPQDAFYRVLAKTLALLLVLHFPLRWWLAGERGELNLAKSLPLELCHLAQLVAIVALLFRGRRLAEILWYWGLTGTMQAILTPDLRDDFPDWGFILFFLNHCGIVVAAFAVVIGQKRYPRRGSAWKVWLWTQLYFWTVLALNFLFGWNYGYLREKPAAGSLLDYMGEFPIYLIWMQALFLLMFFLLELPFRRKA